MIVSPKCVEFIAQWEGFSPVVYDDVAGNATVGYGILLHLGPATAEELARPAITQAEGYTQLIEKIQPYADAVERTTRPLNSNEAMALVSLTFNIGVGGFINSGVRAAVNSRGNVCAELRRIIHGSDGVAYPGLIRRRKAECELYQTPDAPKEDEDLSQEQLDEINKAITALAVANAGSFGKLEADVKDLKAIAFRDALRLNALEAK